MFNILSFNTKIEESVSLTLAIFITFIIVFMLVTFVRSVSVTLSLHKRLALNSVSYINVKHAFLMC